ncbi:MAG: hypothetical protein GEV11_09040 [Streptosporangiales bacterium]|nr:hypothetical protein [Streptosporangiales bacterium]
MERIPVPHYSQRLLLRAETTRERVFRYAEDTGWPLIRQEGDPDLHETFRADFSAGEHAVFRYVEDFMSRQRYVYVESLADGVVDRAGTLVERGLRPERLDALAAACDRAEGVEHGWALVRLGVAAPERSVPEVFDRIVAGFRHPDPEVRRLALWASTYSPWAEYVPHIREVSRTDTVEAVRNRANDLLAVHAAG